MNFWLKAISVFLLAGVKLLPTPFLAVNVNGFSKFEAFLTVSLGGIFSSVIFFFLSEWLIIKSVERRAKKNGKLGVTNRLPFKIKKSHRLIIKIKKKFGYIGICAITPTILSVPIGSIVLARLYRHEKMAYPSLVISILLWTFVLVTIADLFPTIYP